MKSERRSEEWRAALRTDVTFVGIADPETRQALGTPVSHTQERLRRTDRKVMDVRSWLRGDTGISRVPTYMAENPEDAGNPNIAFVPLSLGDTYLNRYERRNHISDPERSVGSPEWFVGDYGLAPQVTAAGA